MACGRGYAVVGPTGRQDAARETVWRAEGAAFFARNSNQAGARSLCRGWSIGQQATRHTPSGADCSSMVSTPQPMGMVWKSL